MSLSEIFRLLARKWVLLLLVPLVLSVSTYFFARQLPSIYTSDTTIYTGIASGYSLTGNAAADYNTTNNAFDNLINLITSRSTKQEVIYSLLAQHLWETGQQPALLTMPTYEGLGESLPARLRKQLTAPTKEATLENVRNYATANNTNAVHRLMNSANPTYSLSALKMLSASRIGSSDLIKLYYESHDPEVARATLDLVTQVFLNQSRNLREGQTASVIKYYEAELKRAKERLDKAEAENLAFNRDNNIINFDSQSNNIAQEKEALTSEITLISQQYAGAQAALGAVNRKLGGRQAELMSSNQLLDQTRKLNRLNANIADLQYAGKDDPGTAARLKQLQAEADRTSQAMQSSVNTVSVQGNSTEGIANKDLLDEWVQNMVMVESNKAKLGVMNRRRQEFEREYQRMAPLGATLKRIAREIDLAEKAYLSVLSSLNASKATQQNTQLTANLKIVDPPNLASRPKTDLVFMMVLLSGLGGFVCVAGTIVGLGLMDKSLKNPTEATRQIGLPVAGMMLDLQAPQTLQLQASQQRSLDQLVRHILLKANTALTPSPFVVGIFSVQRQEGKTTLCQSLSQRCHEMGVQTLALYPDSDGFEPASEAPSLFYPSEAAAVQGWQLDQLIQHATPKRMSEIGSPDVQIVLVEFPALREEALPVGLLRQLHLVFITVPATRTWRVTDHQTVEQLRSATTAPVEVVLSGVAQHYGEEALG